MGKTYTHGKKVPPMEKRFPLIKPTLQQQNHQNIYLLETMHEESMLAKRCRTFPVFQAGDSLCSKQDIARAPRRTFLVFQAGHSVYSMQDIARVPSRTFLVFQAGQSLCSKQDIPYVPRITFRVLQNRTFSFVPITNNAHATF